MFSQNPNTNSSETRTGRASYSFNGKEKDDEWNGATGAALDFGARIYDSRVGRWLSTDAKPKPLESVYTSFSNNPIWYVDKDGKDTLLFQREFYGYAGSGKEVTLYNLTASLIVNGIEKQLPGSYILFFNNTESCEYLGLGKNQCINDWPAAQYNLSESSWVEYPEYEGMPNRPDYVPRLNVAIGLYGTSTIEPGAYAGDLGGCYGICYSNGYYEKLLTSDGVTEFKVNEISGDPYGSARNSMSAMNSLYGLYINVNSNFVSGKKGNEIPFILLTNPSIKTTWGVKPQPVKQPLEIKLEKIPTRKAQVIPTAEKKEDIIKK